MADEVQIENRAEHGVWGHLSKDGSDIVAPQVIPLGGVLVEDVCRPLSLAVVGEFVYEGSRLVQEEIGLTQTQVRAGMTATVTGSKWTGYAIAQE